MVKQEKTKVQKKRVAMGGTGYTLHLRRAMWKWLKENGYEYKDFGSFVEGSQPYVGISQKVAEAVASGEFTDGVILCWSGIGPAITANKIPGIKAAIVTSPMLATNCRKGNGVNVMTSGTLYMKNEKIAVQILKNWLEQDFCLPQWLPEIRKIDAIEKKYMKKK